MYREWCKRNGLDPETGLPVCAFYHILSFSLSLHPSCFVLPFLPSPQLAVPVASSSLVFLSSLPPLSLSLLSPQEPFSALQVHSPFLKTCIIGCERIGKTCLAGALHGDPFDPDSHITQGIVLREFLLPGMRLGEEEVFFSYSSPFPRHCSHLAFTTQLDVTLRIMDVGGQHYFDFLKPMLMQDRALVLLCVRVGDEAQWVAQLREYLDVLSTLMEGGVVIPVITQADLLESEEHEHQVLQLWREQAEPVLQRYSPMLQIDPVITLVSSKTGRGVDAVVARLREGVSKVFFAQFACCFSPLTPRPPSYPRR